MPATGTAHRGRGRPSKGDRHAILTRLPRADADVVMAEAQRLGTSYGEMVAYLVARGLGHDVPKPGHTDRLQGELPVRQSA